MKEEIQKIVCELLDAIEGHLQVSDEVILKQAIKIYLTNEINNASLKKENKKEVKATEKQLAVLNKLKMKIPNDLTKIEASKLISERLKH